MEFTNQAKKALEDGKKVSRKLKQNYVGTEHVLIGLVRQTESLASKVLTQAGDFPGKRCGFGRDRWLYTKITKYVGAGKTGSPAVWHGGGWNRTPVDGYVKNAGCRRFQNFGIYECRATKDFS